MRDGQRKSDYEEQGGSVEIQLAVKETLMER